MAKTRYLQLLRQDCPVPQGTHIIAYARNSVRDEQTTSIPDQASIIQEYCAQHNLHLDKIYFDKAKMATTTERGESLAGMLAWIENNYPVLPDEGKREKQMHEKPFTVIVWEMDRLSRDPDYVRFVNAALQIRGITLLVLVSDQTTGDTIVDEIIRTIKDASDAQLLRNISEDAKRGLASNA